MDGTFHLENKNEPCLPCWNMDDLVKAVAEASQLEPCTSTASNVQLRRPKKIRASSMSHHYGGGKIRYGGLRASLKNSRKQYSLDDLGLHTQKQKIHNLSHCRSLDRGVLKKLQELKRIKRKRSSSLSCLESRSPLPPKLLVHDDLSRSVSFKVDESDGCRAFAPSDLEICQTIGRGFFGEVFKIIHKRTGEVMVMKRLARLDPKHEQTFLKEAAVMRQLHHPNLLRFMGILYKDKQLHLVTEYISGGTLKALLEDPSIELDWLRRISISKDMADGMAYLHSMNIIHRDFNSGNILIREEDGTAIVADFGLARVSSCRRSARRKRRYTVVGNPYWMAPEMLKESTYDERVDVFSFGITLCEIIGRCTADPDFLPRTADFGLHQDRFSTQYCTDCPTPLYQVAFRCASVNPEVRPPLSVVFDWLLLLHVQLDDDPGARLSSTLATIQSKERMEMLSNEIRNYVPPIESVHHCVACPDDSMDSPEHKRRISLDLGYGHIVNDQSFIKPSGSRDDSTLTLSSECFQSATINQPGLSFNPGISSWNSGQP